MILSRPVPVVFAALLLLVLAGPAGAQLPLDSVPHGARIRIRAAEAGIPWRTTGVFDSLASGVIFVHGLNEPRVLRDSLLGVPLGLVDRFDVSGGRKSRWERAGKGALWGLAVYGVMATAYIVHEKTTCEFGCFGDGFAWLGLAGAVPWSAGIGASIGVVLPVETWKPVNITRRR